MEGRAQWTIGASETTMKTMRITLVLAKRRRYFRETRTLGRGRGEVGKQEVCSGSCAQQCRRIVDELRQLLQELNTRLHSMLSQ